jgi:hypothetical protein
MLLLPAMCMVKESSYGRRNATSTLLGFFVGFGSLAAINQLAFGSAWMSRTWLIM